MVDVPSQRLTVPPLENGDRLNRFEFERRYAAMPHLRKAELIEGIVYMPAALRFRSHGQPHSWLVTWLGNYVAMTPGVSIGDNSTVWLDLNNAPQPDIVLLINAEAGGQSHLSEDDYIEGAPELLVEIAASSAAIDLHAKKQAYRRNVVREYLVWQVLEQKLDWFYLEQGEYLSLTIDPEGMLKSRVFPGLWLAVAALLDGNLPQVLAIGQTGLQSAAHAEFVQRLAAPSEQNSPQN